MVHLEYSHVISVGILILANRFSKGSEIIPTFSFWLMSQLYALVFKCSRELN